MFQAQDSPRLVSNAGPVRAYASLMSESPGPPKTVRVIVCGERHRGDDAAALLAAARLAGAAASLADIVEVGQLSVEALLDVPESVALIVADAAVGVAAGQVVALPLSEIAQRGGGATPASSHSLPPDQVLSLAEEIRGSPLDGTFVGVGAAEFRLGETLSPAVEAAVPAFTEALAGEIRRLAGR
jgi:hydrogenase maturation protease